MERTKKNLTANQLHTLASQIVARANLAAKLGYQYNGARDLYQALGYPTVLTFSDYYSRYTRQDIAKAVIDRPVKATWQGELELIETEDAKDTTFEKQWKDLDWKFGIKSILTRLDKMTGIGRYGILLMGLDDAKKIEDFKKPVAKGKRTLMYLKPFSENSAKINSFVGSPDNERYGYPELYDIEVQDVEGNKSHTIQVHYTRVIHIVDDNLESEVYGTPRLEAVYNRLMDLEKLVGGDAEMFWRGARPGYQGKVDDDYQMTQATKDGLLEQVDEYENDLRRIFVNEGVTLSALETQISDPSKHVDVQFQMISAVTGIPKRILTGSERGELSSAQDAGEWKTYVQARREDHAEPRIIRPLINRLIELGVLVKPPIKYRVKWLDLFSISEKERVEIGKGRANALREYSTNPMAEAVVPPDAFLEYFLGLDAGQIELIHKMRNEGLSEEERALMEEVRDIITPPQEETTEEEAETTEETEETEE